MTPTQRGAFCSKCQTDTFDFRSLSNPEVNKILLENKGEHLCGQFTDRQLNSLNSGFLNWKNQKNETFKSKFILALVLVFGLSLFSCNTEEERAIIQLQTVELTQVDSKAEYINEIVNEQEFDLLDYVVELEPIEEVPLAEEVIECVVPGIVVETPEELIMERGEIVSTGGVPAYYGSLGGAMVTTTYWDYLEDTVIVAEDESTLPEVIELEVDFFEANAFPNPTTSDATLALDIKVEGQFEITLFDMGGRLIRSIYSGELVEGRQTFPVELADEQSGMYIIKVIANGQNETVKIQKLN